MNVLVTGGAGYLGSVLVPELLSRGHDVRVLDALMFGAEGIAAVVDHPRFTLVEGDVRRAATVVRAAEGCAAIVHLAALVGEPACAVNPNLTEAINVGGVRHAIAAARAAKAERLIVASTCSNYGTQETAADESAPLRPLSLYAETKVRAETETLAASNGLATCVVRLATLYGPAPRMRFNLLVNEFVRAGCVRGRIAVYGADAWRPYIHVADAARAYATLVEAPVAHIAAQVFNVGSDNARKLDVVELIRAEVAELEVDRAATAPDKRDYRVDFDKFTRRFDFRPERRLADGVGELCAGLRTGRWPEPFDPRYDLWIDEERLAASLARCTP